MHNDLKLENICIGWTDPSVVYLIDFGLSTTYLEADGSHSTKTFINKFSGNIMFTSLNSCRGNTKSRRDDIQALFNLLVYLLNDNKLPWSDFGEKFKNKNYQFKDYLVERLKLKYSQEEYKMVPENLKKLFKLIFKMKYEEEPPYAALREQFKKEQQREVLALQQEFPGYEYSVEWLKQESNLDDK